MVMPCHAAPKDWKDLVGHAGGGRVKFSYGTNAGCNVASPAEASAFNGGIPKSMRIRMPRRAALLCWETGKPHACWVGRGSNTFMTCFSMFHPCGFVWGWITSTPKFDGESPFSLHQWPIMAILAGYHGIEQPPKKNKRMQKSNKSLFQKDFTHFNVFFRCYFFAFFGEFHLVSRPPPLPCAPPATHWFITHMNSITISITHTIINYS